MSDSPQYLTSSASSSPDQFSPISNTSSSDSTASTVDHQPAYTTSYVPFASPPTPSPSPSPRPSKTHKIDRQELALLRDVRPHFNSLTTHAKNAFLSELLAACPVETLVHVCNIITPRIKRDFLRDLPTEIALHIISFINDGRTLTRASAVSQYWHSLLSDECLWRSMCKEHKYCSDRITGSRNNVQTGFGGIYGSPRARVVRRLSIAEFDPDAGSDVRSANNGSYASAAAAFASSAMALSDSESTASNDDEDDNDSDDNDMELEFVDERAVLEAEAMERNDISFPLPGRHARDSPTTNTSGAPGSSLPPRLPHSDNPSSGSKSSGKASSRNNTIIRPPATPFSYKQHFKISYLTGTCFHSTPLFICKKTD